MFSGNTAFLVVSPTLQDYLVDKTSGLPLAAGIVTFYQDNQRQTLKNVYYQQGTPGNYTYTALPNPLTLSAVGTIQDNNGNDVIPYFYPINETNNTDQQFYYVTVYNSSNVLQFTRQGFPFVPAPSTTPTDAPLLENYLYNNLFWRNGGTNAALSTNVLLAPGSHDGFVLPGIGETINGSQPSPGHDIRFIKSKTGATDQITYQSFGTQTLPSPEVTPQNYVNLQCTAATTGENYKIIQFPVQLNVKNLQNVEMTFSIYAQGSASGTNQISVYLYQFLGIGASSQPAPVIQGTGIIQLNTSWTLYTVPVAFTNLSSSLTLGAGGDDAWYIQIWFPVNTTFNINFSKPSLYLGNAIPQSQYTPYDQIDTVIGTPRTGDARTSLNSFYPYGWVPATNGFLCLANPNSVSGVTRANVDTWPLFHLLWQFSQPYDSGSNFNPICPIYDSTGVATNYGASAYSDFVANKELTLTQIFGRVLTGSVPVSAILPIYNQSITASNSTGNLLITVGNGSALFNGMPIAFTTTGSLPGNILANVIYYMSNVNTGSGTFTVSTTYATSLTGTSLVAWSSAGSNSNVLNYVTGVPYGELFHNISVAESAILTYTATSGFTFRAGSCGGAGTPLVENDQTASTGSFTVNTSVSSNAGGRSHNNIVSTTGMNIFIKL